MAKYATHLCFIFLLTSCTLFSKKSEGITTDTTKIQHFVGNDTISNDIEEHYTDPDDLKGVTEIHFTELWIWDYLNEEGEWDEMWVFREPELNYWLFERQTSFGMSSEMCEWVLAKPNGEYILSYQPAEMNTPNSLEIQKLEFYDESGFPEFWEPTGEVKTFGDTIHGWDSYEGEKYEVHFKGQPDPSIYYLGTTDIDMRALYHFNDLEGDIRLPIFFPIDLPKNTIILNEDTTMEYYNMKVSYRFNSTSPNSYYVYIPDDL